MTLRFTLLLPLAAMALGCGAKAGGTSDAGLDAGSEDAGAFDSGILDSCPAGYAEGTPVQVTYKSVVSAVSCWQATLAASQVKVSGIPDFELGPLQLTVEFNSSSMCTFSAGQTIPLTSSCVVVEASSINQWFNVANLATGGVNPTGSLTVTDWPTASGQSLSVSFSSDATVVIENNTPATAVPIAGTFSVTAM